MSDHDKIEALHPIRSGSVVIIPGSTARSEGPLVNLGTRLHPHRRPQYRNIVERVNE
jgi:hypothetical protein